VAASELGNQSRGKKGADGNGGRWQAPRATNETKKPRKKIETKVPKVKLNTPLKQIKKT